MMTLGSEFEEICKFLADLPLNLANTETIKLKNRDPIILFAGGQSKVHLQGISTAFRRRVEQIREEVNAYIQTLNPLKDFISLKPRNVLDYYHEAEVSQQPTLLLQVSNFCFFLDLHQVLRE